MSHVSYLVLKLSCHPLLVSQLTLLVINTMALNFSHFPPWIHKYLQFKSCVQGVNTYHPAILRNCRSLSHLQTTSKRTKPCLQQSTFSH